MEFKNLEMILESEHKIQVHVPQGPTQDEEIGAHLQSVQTVLAHNDSPSTMMLA